MAPPDAGVPGGRQSATTAHITPNVVADVERSAKEFGWHVISLRDEIIALFGERNNGHCIGFHFNFQPRLVGDIPQRFAKWNIVQRDRDARASRA